MLVWEAVPDNTKIISKGGNGKLLWAEGKLCSGWAEKLGDAYEIMIQLPDNVRLFQQNEVYTPSVPDERFWVNYGMVRQLQLVEALARIEQLEREIEVRQTMLKQMGVFVTRELPPREIPIGDTDL